MKEASGELRMTAIAVVAIAAIGVVFTTLIWPGIKSNITRSTNCAQAYNCTGTGNMLNCTYNLENGTATQIQCPSK